MNCTKCGSPTTMQVQMIISAPGELYHLFSKTNLRRKDVHSMGVLWETANFYCENPKCGHIDKGYGNYITRLRDRESRMKAIIAECKAALEEAKHGGVAASEALRALVDILSEEEPAVSPAK